MSGPISPEILRRADRDASNIVAEFLADLSAAGLVNPLTKTMRGLLVALISRELRPHLDHEAKIVLQLARLHQEGIARQKKLEEFMRAVEEMRRRPPVINWPGPKP